LHGLEKSLILAPLEEQTRIEQRIKLQLKPKIQEYEKERWEILSQQAESLKIPENDAQVAISEIVEQVGKIELYQPHDYPNEILLLLQQIRNKLNEPGTSAAAKLKGIISSVPPFIGLSYEAEIDTENFFRKHFPTFSRLIGGATSK
jgi:hypothetical protein